MQAKLSTGFAFPKATILIRLLLGIFILNDGGLSFSSLLLEQLAANALGDLGHVEGILLRQSRLLRLGHIHLTWDEITIGILDKDGFTLQLLLLFPHLLVGLNETILIVLDLLQFLLAFCNFKSLSPLGLGTGNELRKPTFAGG
jgi:hypothetical protein